MSSTDVPEKAAGPPVFAEAERRKIVAAVAERQAADPGLTHAMMGRILGCSAAVWSQVVRGVYAGKTDKYVARAAEWLRERSGRDVIRDRAFVETSISRQIRAVCDRAWVHSRIGLVLTPAGCGKTMALREFARRRGRHAVYVQVGEMCATKGGLLAELVARLGLSLSPKAKMDAQGRAVRDHLAASYVGGRGTPFVLVIDEATRIQASPLNLLRGFVDDPECRAALVLAGTLELDPLIHARG